MGAFISGAIIAVLTIAYLLVCLFLIIVVLMQEGKGGGISGLVSGASPLSDSLGAHGAEHTLRTWTKYSAIAFMVLAIMLTILGPRLLRRGGDDLTGQLPATPPPATTSTGLPPGVEIDGDVQFGTDVEIEGALEGEGGLEVEGELPGEGEEMPIGEEPAL